MIKKKFRIFLSAMIFTPIFSLGFSPLEEAKAYNAGGDGIIKINSWDLNNFNSTLDLWTQTRVNYAPEEVKNRFVSGDFDGNGEDEIASFYDYGNSTTKIHRFYDEGGGYKTSTPWNSGTGNFNADSITNKVVAGDFNGDGSDEILVLYDYKNSNVTMFQFSLNSDGQAFSDKSVWSSKSFTGDKVTAMVPGDFNGDGSDEVLIFYDYGNNVTGMFELKMNADGIFTDRYSWESKTYNSNNIRNKTVAGDFNGDGSEEVAMFYDYGKGITKIWTLYNDNNVYSEKLTWEAASFDSSKIDGKVVATRNNNGSQDKIVALYDYGNNKTGIFTFEVNANNKFIATKVKDLNNYEAERIKGRVSIGKYNGQDTRLVAMYDGTVVQSQSKGDKVIAEAKKQIGKEYLYGAIGPDRFDCSGLVQYVLKKAVGINLPRTTYQQINVGTPVSYSQLQPGDLVFTYGVDHVGIYVGGGKYIHAPYEGETVKISPITDFYAARRVLN